MVAMRFDFRDIFKAARLAFNFQRLWIQFYGLFFGFLGYVILTYLSLIAAGKNFGVIWSRFGLLPSIAGIYLPWYSWILFGAGILLFVFFWLVSSAAVARATYMNLKGNTFYTWKEAFNFAFKKKGGSLITTPIAIAAIAFFVGLGGVVVGLLARIPYAGWLGLSLFIVVWFLASLFLVFVLLALAVSLLQTPAILATTDDDAFEGIFQSFSTLYSQPWRFILYELILLIVAVLGLGFLSFFAKQAWNLMSMIFIWGMGEKFIDLSFGASYLLQNWVYPAILWSKALCGDYASYFFFARDFSAVDLPVVMNIASWIIAIFMAVIGGFIASYPLAIFNAGQGIIFLILKKKKDDENLLERKNREEEIEEEAEEEDHKEEEKPKTEKKPKDTGKSKKKAPAKKK